MKREDEGPKSSDEQMKSKEVKQHTRLAEGVPLKGSSFEPNSEKSAIEKRNK